MEHGRKTDTVVVLPNLTLAPLGVSVGRTFELVVDPPNLVVWVVLFLSDCYLSPVIAELVRI